ncbi:MAG: hypothetical protein ACSHX8_16155 [Opitutaceae bacterium]
MKKLLFLFSILVCACLGYWLYQQQKATPQTQEVSPEAVAQDTLEEKPAIIDEMPPSEEVIEQAVIESSNETPTKVVEQNPFEARAKLPFVTLTDIKDRKIEVEIVDVDTDGLRVIRKADSQQMTIAFELLTENDRAFAQYLNEHKESIISLASVQAAPVDMIEDFTDYIKISSVEALASAASKSNQKILMTPGVYQIEDYLTPEVIAATDPHAVMGSAMITFSGNENVFELSGVTIEVNTELLNDFGRKVMEFYVSGSGNQIRGLTVTDIGNFPTASGGQSFVVGGEGNTIQGVTLNVSGSSPYGYGDLLGKGGGGALKQLRKHSSMLITGLNIKILDCSVYSKAFGHLFFVQGGRNVHFENCYAEALTRTTDEMLAETSGPAYDADFKSVYGNYKGKKVITPGYTKSLSECGFRNYGAGGSEKHTTGAMTFINCRAKNCRVGFALTRFDGDILIQNSEATGCEVAYNIDGVTIEDSRGDVVNGPLLYINEGDKSRVDLALMPDLNITTVHALACIAGEGHEVTLTRWEDKSRRQELPILLGASRSSGCNPFSPLGEGQASSITLNNYTGMPVSIGKTVSSSKINSNGAVSDKGSGNQITRVR